MVVRIQKEFLSVVKMVTDNSIEKSDGRCEQAQHERGNQHGQKKQKNAQTGWGSGK